MPIYEFRCLGCDGISEILFLSSSDNREIVCRHCGGEDLERVMSASNFSLKSGASSGPASSCGATTKSCPSGSCTTFEIPGKHD